MRDAGGTSYQVACGCGVSFTCGSAGELKHRTHQHAGKCSKTLVVTTLVKAEAK